MHFKTKIKYFVRRPSMVAGLKLADLTYSFWVRSCPEKDILTKLLQITKLAFLQILKLSFLCLVSILLQCERPKNSNV